MKRISILCIITVMLFGSLFFATSQATAGPAMKPTPKPKKTEQAVAATQRAEDKAERSAEHPKGKKEHFKGTIEAVSAGSLTLMLRDGSTVTVSLLPETKVKISHLKEAITLSSISRFNLINNIICKCIIRI